MTNAEVLTQMIEGADEEAANLQINIDGLNDQITETQAQIEAMLFTMSSATSATEDILDTKGDVTYTYGSFGVTNVVDWMVGTTALSADGQPENYITTIDTGNIEVSASHADKFSPGNVLILNDEVSVTTSTVTTVLSAGTTTITISPSAAPPVINVISDLSYQYNGVGWDSDADLVARKGEFDYAYDYLVDSWDNTGSYGLYEKLGHLNTAKGMIQGNKDKTEDRSVYLSTFAG